MSVSVAVDHVIAPQIAARLDDFAQGDQQLFASLIRSLTPAQLAGRSVLPDPLPSPPGVYTPIDVTALPGAERRLLLIAALSPVDRVAVVLEAAAVNIEFLLSPSVAACLVLDGGRYRFSDPRLRAALHSSAGASETHEAHAALARAHRANGYPLIAKWHAALSGVEDHSRAPHLIALADQRLQRGDVDAAYRIASHSARHLERESRAKAEALAARAALWGGHLDDAELAYRTAAELGRGNLAEEARAGLRAVAALRVGPEGEQEPMQRLAEQMRPLAPLISSVADRRGWEALNAVIEQFVPNPEEADALNAVLSLSTVPARPNWPWASDIGALSPLAEAHVRIMQAAFQVHANDHGGAAVTLSRAAERLPLAYAGAGAVSSIVRLVASRSPDLDPRLADVYEVVGPQRQARYTVSGPRTGSHTVVAARATVSQEPSEGPGGAFQRWLESFSSRERSVVRLLAEGLSNRSIAEALGISERTVEVHLARVFRKCGARSRSELLAHMLRISRPRMD